MNTRRSRSSSISAIHWSSHRAWFVLILMLILVTLFQYQALQSWIPIEDEAKHSSLTALSTTSMKRSVDSGNDRRYESTDHSTENEYVHESNIQKENPNVEPVDDDMALYTYDSILEHDWNEKEKENEKEDDIELSLTQLPTQVPSVTMSSFASSSFSSISTQSPSLMESNRETLDSKPVSTINSSIASLLYTSDIQDKSSVPSNQSRNALLPKKLILVTGLESSGTKIVTEALAIATGAYEGNINTLEKSGNSFHGRVLGSDIEVQHQSLPWGSRCTDEHDANHLHTMSVLVPRQCGCASKMNNFLWDTPTCDAVQAHKDCEKLGISQRLSYPNRFFLNITSHIKWYEEQGVEASAVIIMRDKEIESISKLHDHCRNKALLQMENEHGLNIITEALQNLSFDKINGRNYANLVLVSYESMMSLGKPYFDRYIYERLGIAQNEKQNKQLYVPSLQNGNHKYLLENS